MKNSKRLATLAILFALVGCGGGNEGKNSSNNNSSTPINSTSSSVNAGAEDLAYLQTVAQRLIYDGRGWNTAGVRGDITDLITSLDDGKVTITYSSSNEEFIKIEGNTGKVTLPESGSTSTGYVVVTITATLSYNGQTVTKDFMVKVNESLSSNTTIAEVLQQTQAGLYEVKGTVTAINARGFTMYDGTGTILVYLNSAPEVELGDYVKVGGEIGFYQEIPQFTSSAAVEVLDEEAPAEAIFDYSNPEVWGLEELRAWVDAGAKVGPYVTIKGTLSVSGGYYNMTIEGDSVIVGSLSYPAADSGLDAFDGKVIEATGILLYRSGSSHDYCNLIVTAAKEAELDEEAKAQAVKETLTLPESVTDTLALPSTGAYDAVITWESSNTAVINIDENGVTVTQGDADVEVTLTATITVGKAVLTKEIVVTVKCKDPYAPVLVTAPQADTEYKFMVAQGNTNQNLYFAGAEQGNYLASTENLDEAATLVLEAVEGGYNVKVLLGEETKYLNVEVSGKYVNGKVQDTATTLWTWNADLNTIVTNQTTSEGTSDFYMGTYGTYTTISLSKTSYAATSFVGHFYQVPELPDYVVAPAVDTAYNLMVTQENTTQDLYFAGAEQGNYLASTENVAEAAVLKLVETEGGYHVQVVSAEGTKYLNVEVSGKYVNGKVQDEPTTVWTWNAELNTLVTNQTTSEGTNDFYMGTYGTYTTISLSKTSYASTSFVSHLYADVEEPVTPPTPEVDNLFANEGTMFGEEGLTHEAANAGKNILFWNDQNWCGSYVGVESSLEDGVYTYTLTTENAACAWGFQLFASVAEKVAGDEFTTTFVLNSTVAGKIRVNGEIIDIVVGDNEISTTKIYNGTLGEGSSQAAIIFGIDNDAANNQVVQNATYKVSNFVITKKTVTEEPPVVVPPSVEATLAASISFSDVANRTEFDTSHQVWTLNGIIVKNDKGSSTSNIADYSNPARFYKSTNLTIEYTEEIVKIVINCKYADKCYTGTETIAGATFTVEGTSMIIILDTPATSFTIESLATQLRVDSIDVYTAE